jgi:hypothetical protein
MSSRNYYSYVVEARSLLEGIEDSKIKIGHMALQVCTIRLGGHNKAGYYTLKKFSEDIGVNRKTLSAWAQLAEVEKTTGVKIPAKKHRNIIEGLREAGKISDILKDPKKAKSIVSKVLKPSDEEEFFRKTFDCCSRINHLVTKYDTKQFNANEIKLLRLGLEKALRRLPSEQ